MTSPDEQPYRPGVGAVVFAADGRVLVARRTDTAGDAWQLPQGGVKAGETAEQALRRELREEIGTDRVEILAEHPEPLRYDLPAELAAGTWGGRFRGQEQRWFAVLLRGPDAEINLDGDGSDAAEFDAWQWVEIGALPDLAIGFKRALYARLVEAFAHIPARVAAAATDRDGR